MHTQTIILSLTALILGAQASWLKRAEPDFEVITWSKSGARYRPAEHTYTPETVTYTKEATYYPSAIINMRAVPSERQIKRAFLGNWTYRGCANDDDTLPTLVAPFPYQLANTDVSSASCANFCDSRGSKVAALQNGDDCWCGETDDTIVYGDESRCNIPCSANPGEHCGGAQGLTVFVKA